MLDKVAKEKREKCHGPHDDSQSEGVAQAIGPDGTLITARHAPLWSTKGHLENTSPFVKKKFEVVTTLDTARAAPQATTAGRCRVPRALQGATSPHGHKDATHAGEKNVAQEVLGGWLTWVEATQELEISRRMLARYLVRFAVNSEYPNAFSPRQLRCGTLRQLRCGITCLIPLDITTRRW